MTKKGLVKYVLYKVLPLNMYLKVTYRYFYKRKLNLKNPKLYSEKLFVLNIKNREKTSLIQEIYDKYTVRKYIEDRIGSGYSTKLYGNYESVDEIDFDKLPESYVLKLTQSSGYNIINNGKTDFDINLAKEKLSKWLKVTTNLKIIEREMKEYSYYFNGKPTIICEEYLEEKEGHAANDIKFMCYDGKVDCYSVDFGSVDDKGAKGHHYIKNFYRLNKEFIPVKFRFEHAPEIESPDYKNFDKMIEIAETLSKGFPFLRVDMYNIDGRIIVGELTPIPMGAAIPQFSDKYELEWGNLLKIE